MTTTHEPDLTEQLADEAQILIDFASVRHGTLGVPAGWIRPDEVEALLEHGVATCPDCEVRITRCSFCGPDIPHCDCTQTPDCIDDARHDDADHRREDDR